MDSGNSSSMQSSSGGDDQEYDSRSLFHHSMNMNPPPPPPPHHPNFLQPQLFHWPPAPLLRSDPDTNYLSFAAAGGHFAGTSPAPPPSAAAASIPSASSPAPLPRSAASHPPKIAGPSKNPKKRTRASRRAPTTVLTTDTSNFRAMVQEYTGIPDPPFSSSSGSAASRRLDLFSTAGSSMRLAAAAASLGGQPFRPAAQRLPSSSFLGGVMNQDPLGALGSGQPDPTLAFQSLIQPPLLFPPPSNMNSSAFGINMGGLLVPSQNLSSGMNPPGVGVGFGSSSEPEHGGTNPNNDYVTSQGNAEYRSQ